MGVNIRKVAEVCNVSPATVSRALNGKTYVLPGTRERIMRAAQECGYRPFPNSDLLHKPKAPTVALVLPDDFGTVQRNPFYSIGLRAVIERMEEWRGAFTVPSTGTLADLCDTPFHLSLLRGAEGILVLYRRLTDAEYLGIERAGVPCLVVGYKPSARLNFVRLDMASGAALAVRHLYGLGHRRIGYWGWSHPIPQDGFRRGLASLGLPCDEKWVVSLQPKGAEGDWEKAFPWDRIDDTDAPTGFVCHDDIVASEMLRRMAARGRRAPKDFSVVGFDDLPMAVECTPPLTTIRQPVHSMAVRGLEQLMEIARGKRKSCRETIMPEIVVRESAGPPRA